MAVLLEMVNNPAAYDSVNEAQYLGRFEKSVGYRMQMVGHYYISID
ncbi:MAG TPA: hypothetical protein VGJ66_22280 [Pyrinomonadaceae bacterium]|jgi:hypothetical protein